MSDGSEVTVRKADPMTSLEASAPVDRADAFDMFLNKAMTLDDIAILKGIDRRIVSKWSREGKWAERKAKLEDELMNSVAAAHKNWAVENKFREAKIQLEQAHSLQDAITAVLEDRKKNNNGLVSDMLLKRLAEALSAATAISARAVGLGEAVNKGGSSDGDGGAKSGKQPLIIIGMKPTVAGEEPSINVESREI